MQESEQHGVSAMKQRMPEIVDLFKVATAVLEDAKQAWPDRYDYIVVDPPDTRGGGTKTRLTKALPPLFRRRGGWRKRPELEKRKKINDF